MDCETVFSSWRASWSKKAFSRDSHSIRVSHSSSSCKRIFFTTENTFPSTERDDEAYFSPHWVSVRVEDLQLSKKRTRSTHSFQWEVLFCTFIVACTYQSDQKVFNADSQGYTNRPFQERRSYQVSNCMCCTKTKRNTNNTTCKRYFIFNCVVHTYILHVMLILFQQHSWCILLITEELFWEKPLLNRVPK